MKKIIRIIGGLLLPALIIGGFWYINRDRLDNLWWQWRNQAQPCRQPITYSLGSFDKRFNLSEKDFLAAISQAEQIWEAPAGRQLFAYDPGGAGEVKVNLIYDLRQEATDQLKKTGLLLKNDRSSYDEIKARYETIEGQYLRAKTALDNQVADLEAAQRQYEAEVERWNSRGGAPSQVYAKLEADRLALNAQVAAVNRAQDALNVKINELNGLAVVLNRLATSLNIVVDKYNVVNVQLPGEFQEGTYESGPQGQAINIYQFDDQTTLVRLLAHELGHALGLEHLEDPKAIMYRLNEGVNEKITAADLAALKDKCQLK